jgi:hypothetical protein
MEDIVLRACAVRAAALRVLPFLARLTLLSLLVAAGAGAAKAQDVDWVLNLDDTGFDPLPGGRNDLLHRDRRQQWLRLRPRPRSTSRPGEYDADGASGTITGCTPIPQSAGGTVTCKVPLLAPTASANLVLDVLTTLGDGDAERKRPHGRRHDPTNNACRRTRRSRPAPTGAHRRRAGDRGSAGSVVTYVFTAETSGPNALTSATLQFPVPTGLVNISPPPGCTLSGSPTPAPFRDPSRSAGPSIASFTGQVSRGRLDAHPARQRPRRIAARSGARNNTANTQHDRHLRKRRRITKSRGPSGVAARG